VVTEVRRPPVPEPAARELPAGETVRSADAARPPEGGNELAEVFNSIRSPAAFRSLGGVTVCWHLTVFGPRGETIGTREVIQRADVNQVERDRLESGDRVFGCSGGLVFASRGGMPWPSLQEVAAQELRFYGMLVRSPWLFADSGSFAVMGRDQVQRGGERLVRLKIERRSDTRTDLFGPEERPVARDRFDLLCEPLCMQPRELVYQFANSQVRRMLLEDWREVAGVKLPHRRILVDADGRQTTQIDVKSIEIGQAINDRDFRLR
jgi:hypothetical protein